VETCDVFIGGGLTDKQLGTIYKNSEAFVSLSEHEGFGVPLVEAMGCGLPVFALDRAAVRETIGEMGAAFEHLSELKAQLVKYLKNATKKPITAPKKYNLDRSLSEYNVLF
jgi:hypothetical protein